MNYTVLFFLVLICLIVMTAWIFFLQRIVFKLNDLIREKETKRNKTNKTINRKHSKLNPVSFSNPIQSRKNPYEEYKNDKGLYEPRTPKKGIVIKEEE